MLNTNKMSTDELFEALPSFINIDGRFYSLKIIKGNKRIIIEYNMNESEGGATLGCRSGKNIKLALKSMLDWLIKFEYYSETKTNIFVDMTKQVQRNKNK